MHNRTHEAKQIRTLIGHFTETWNAEGAIEDLNFAGFSGHLRYQQQVDLGLADDTKEEGGLEPFMRDPHQDSELQFSVNPEAEEYYAEGEEKKHHLVFVEAHEDWDRAIEIIRLHHGEVEVRDGSFFSRSDSGERRLLGESHLEAPRIHPTQAIERPKDSFL